jgi:acyl-CoA dehydrogenase
VTTAFQSWRRQWLTTPIFRWAQSALPAMSETESIAIESGDTWWDAALFSGDPDWSQFLRTAPARLNNEEQAFLDGPVEEVCRMTNDWQVRFELFDLPPEVWTFLKGNCFFGMIIPKEFGGLGFSAYAHSQVIRKLSSHSITLAITVMVPNSLGPGELLLHYGTPEQKEHYLPRLADGREIPCFALTSPEAGSDAAAMIDQGTICWGEIDGERVLGVKLTWSKRYITLCPIATVIGLAVKLYDPEHLFSGKSELGITVILVPVDTPGVTTGHRHYPAHQVFQNGPTQGKDVFLPLSQVIGGETQIGQGWKMLMNALAAGRGISLPSLSAAGAALSARTTGAYARIRQQFGLPVAMFEGVQAPLSRIAGLAYQLDAARRLTCAALDQGHKPAVIAAIMKAHATEGLRVAVDDAMDIHGGKAVMDGPHNYLGDLYRAIPVAITVEGANILTRNLMIFGQGAIRCHPYLLSEMQAIAKHDLEGFDIAFWKHVGHSLRNLGRAFWRSWTSGRFVTAPIAGAVAGHYRQLSRYSAVLALLSDMAFLILGGGLKRRELLSARLGDILSELYLLSAVLKRYDDERCQPADEPLVHWCMASGFKRIETSIDEILANFPNRPMAWLLRFLVPADSEHRLGPDDRLIRACAGLISEPGETRTHLTADLFAGSGDDPLCLLEQAVNLTHQVEPLRQKLRHEKLKDYQKALDRNVITEADLAELQKADAAVHRAIMVDDFAPEDLKPRRHPTSKEASP